MADGQHSRRILITGVSAGIGLGLARECLRQGWTVYGTARHAPDIGKSDKFVFVPCDLNKDKEIGPAFRRLLNGVTQLDLAVLNAGILGPFGDLPDQPLDEIQRVMQVNVWANKSILDVLFESKRQVSQVVAMSSGISEKGYRGWGGYAISKTALNMLINLAALERPKTHFTSLAPGLVDTAMQDQLCSLSEDTRYPSLELLRCRRGTDEMPDGNELGPRLLRIFEQLPELFESGAFANLRRAPLADIT